MAAKAKNKHMKGKFFDRFLQPTEKCILFKVGGLFVTRKRIFLSQLLLFYYLRRHFENKINDPFIHNLNQKHPKIPPRRGIEPRSPAWQAGILTTILTRISYKYAKEHTYCKYFLLLSHQKHPKNPPRRGIEPRSPAWQAGILTTILTRIC